MSFPRIPLSQMFTWIATFQNLILDYEELKEGFANSIRFFSHYFPFLLVFFSDSVNA
jgi:hypothetical protein